MSVTVALHNLLVASTFALSIECTARGGLETEAILPASLAIRSISDRL